MNRRGSREAAEVRQSDSAGSFFELASANRGCNDPAMQKYNQYCPVARASEILADRWTPLIVRELILGSHRFNEIERGLPGISRSLLASRLRDLEHAGVIERLPGAQPNVTEYHLSDAGRELKPVVEALGALGCSLGVRRAEAGGAGRRVAGLEDSPADRSRAAAGQADGGRVRLHGSARTSGVARARASRGVGVRDAPEVRRRPRRSGGSRVLLPCVAGPRRLRRGHFDAAPWSWKGHRLWRSSFRDGSCGVRWPASFASNRSSLIADRAAVGYG